MLRRIGLLMNGTLRKTETGQVVSVGSPSFERDLKVSVAKWDVAKMIGGHVGWRARCNLPETSENDYSDIWNSYQQLITISHPALKLIVPYATAVHIEPAIGDDSLEDFACAWLTVRFPPTVRYFLAGMDD